MAILATLPVDGAKNGAQFREHALRMTYPSFRDGLLRIAAEQKLMSGCRGVIAFLPAHS